MEPLSISKVAAVIGASSACSSEKAITGVSFDSRSLRPGDLFFALAGEKADGHRFVAEAFRKGAAGSVVRSEVEGASGPQLIVADPLKALGQLATWYRRRYNIPVVAVTGSVGKTTTKELIGLILSESWGSICISEQNYNTEIGVPMALLSLNDHHRAGVFELAMRGPGQIRELTEMVKPDVGVITNIGLSHVELLATPEAIAAAKGELLTGLKSEATAVLPADDRFYPFLKVLCRCKTLSFGLSDGAAIQATDIKLDENGRPSFICDGHSVRMNVAGRHQIANALAALGVAYALNIPFEVAAIGISKHRPGHHRGAVMRASRGFEVIDDVYNASPASMEAALRTMAACPRPGGGRKIAVLGDMKELGGYAEESHLQVGELTSKVGVDLLIAVGELAKWIAEGAAVSGMPSGRIVQMSDSMEAAQQLPSIVQPGDLVLVKGSRAMAMEKIVEALLAD
ncbi:MAG: UDP-N-acetylmuramoyl-tripeptide--D-alanyl-D-alanine ligase [Armatimonadetes bacterium]|nr:UDP-N-acetylmuramoyl-tripeptide--D-alanyl-D-alanine ligase [Armatimonadota bacterium]